MFTQPSVGLVLLAAGASTRMGEPKRLLRVGGQSLLRRVARAALASRCRPVVIVLGAGAEVSRGEVEALPARVRINEAWAEGMGSSIRAGVAALLEEERAVCGPASSRSATSRSSRRQESTN